MNELDGRYSTAEEAIIDSFFLLVREKDYDKITVADVVKKSGIVRSTFYNHYENVDELISAVEDKTIDDIFKLMESFHPQNDHELCKSYFLAICSDWYKQAFGYCIIVVGGSLYGSGLCGSTNIDVLVEQGFL